MRRLCETWKVCFVRVCVSLCVCAFALELRDNENGFHMEMKSNALLQSSIKYMHHLVRICIRTFNAKKHTNTHIHSFEIEVINLNTHGQLTRRFMEQRRKEGEDEY